MREHRTERRAHSARKLCGGAEKRGHHSFCSAVQIGERADGGEPQGAQRSVDGDYSVDDVL